MGTNRPRLLQGRRVWLVLRLPLLLMLTAPVVIAADADPTSASSPTVGAAVSPATPENTVPDLSRNSPSTGATDLSAEARAVAHRIDELLARRWRAEQVVPADPADEAEFLRRASLHIAGVIPPVSTVRRFLADRSADKRERYIAELLEGTGYVVHFTRFWRQALLPEIDSDQQRRFLVPAFESWLRGQLLEGTPYDQFVREIIAARFSGDAPVNRPYSQLQTASPLAFYQSKQLAPENVAAATARIFLGVRIECAQCHDHPFDDWKRENFWSFAAFFGGLVPFRDNNVFGQLQEVANRHQIQIPGTKQTVQAKYLGGGEPTWEGKVGPRETLANWITARDNPYFAKATVNRLWGHFFGTGLVEPVDDLSAHNLPSHPELLDLLADEFVQHDYDLRFVIRVLTATQAYQLSSRQTHPSQEAPELYAKMAVQGLTAAQIYDCLIEATGGRRQFPTNRFVNNGTEASSFEELFASDGQSRIERQTTILQALQLMNGTTVAQATSLQQSQTLAAVASASFFDTEARIETLYLAALTRLPRPDELARLKAYVDSGGPAKNSRFALADVFWALLNSSEFLFNH